MRPYRSVICLTASGLLLISLIAGVKQVSAEVMISPQTQECIDCHLTVTPGIVKDWSRSRHSKTLPEQAIKKPKLERRISAKSIPEALGNVAVGCFECHSLNGDKHADNFEHMGFRINVVVSPGDCRTCHPQEVEQYQGSKKAFAYRNLMGNELYRTLVDSITGKKVVKDGKITTHPPTDSTLQETCLSCHGTRVEVRGMKEIETPFGTITVPDLTNWPNQGVGRINPDGTLGACTSCHPRHGFSIEVARKPYTCAQCHLEPDVPAWNVYKASKHGNIFFSQGKEWDFQAVPWVLGEDFTAPTCATCHNSLVVSPEGEVLAERTHDFGSRLWVRLFGLIYSHPQPKSGDVTVIRNDDGLPLPTTFDGKIAEKYLIGKAEQETRKDRMKAVCNGCHGTDWTNSHFAKLDKTILETDVMVRAATDLMTGAWQQGVEDSSNPFDESIEKMWIKQWLFYSNTIKYASAMTGAADYAAFNLGWWELSRNLQEMKDMIELKAVKVPEKDND